MEKYESLVTLKFFILFSCLPAFQYNSRSYIDTLLFQSWIVYSNSFLINCIHHLPNLITSLWVPNPRWTIIVKKKIHYEHKLLKKIQSAGCYSQVHRVNFASVSIILIYFYTTINSLRLNDIYIYIHLCQKSMPLLIQIMAHCLSSTKPLS